MRPEDEYVIPREPMTSEARREFVKELHSKGWIPPRDAAPRTAPTLIPMGGRGRILLFGVVPEMPEGFGHRTAYALTVKAGSRLARIAKVAAFLWRDVAHVAAYPADAEVIAHEAVHLWQCYRECNGSWLRFLWRYWRLARAHGYDAHPWEVEARALAPTMARQLADAFTDL